METAWKGVLSRLKWSEIVSVVLIWEVERGNMFFQISSAGSMKCLSLNHGSKLLPSLPWHFLFFLKLLFHLQECILRSQTVLDMHSTYICVPKNWIRSVERMAALTTIDAFSAVKSCKNTRLNIKSPQIMVGLSKMIKFYDNLDITYIEELSIKLQEHMCIFL